MSARSFFGHIVASIKVGQGRSSCRIRSRSRCACCQRGWVGCSRFEGHCARNVLVFTTWRWYHVSGDKLWKRWWLLTTDVFESSSCQSTIPSVVALYSAQQNMPRWGMQRLANKKLRQHSNNCYTRSTTWPTGPMLHKNSQSHIEPVNFALGFYSMAFRVSISRRSLSLDVLHAPPTMLRADKRVDQLTRLVDL